MEMGPETMKLKKITVRKREKIVQERRGGKTCEKEYFGDSKSQLFRNNWYLLEEQKILYKIAVDFFNSEPFQVPYEHYFPSAC